MPACLLPLGGKAKVLLIGGIDAAGHIVRDNGHSRLLLT